MTPPPPSPLPPNAPPKPSLIGRLLGVLQLPVAVVLTGGVLAYLLFAPHATAPVEEAAVAPPEPVRVAGPRLLQVEPDSKLASKLHTELVQSKQVSAPVLSVTGTVAASLRPGRLQDKEYWQFNSAEVLTAYTDWQKAVSDIAYTETQLKETKLLAQTRNESQQKVVDRLQKLVAAGTDTPKDLAVEQTNLLQYQIQGRKELHEAETAARLAKRAEAAQARQLQQAGLDPALLASVGSDADIVMADVPEGALTRVKVGQGVEAKFFGLPGQTFTGKIKVIAPVLSKERRSLRVLFTIDDPQDQLRPGMFADIGIGTDARPAMLVPADAILHAGRVDYVLVASGPPGQWRATEVQVGEAQGQMVEILSGVGSSDRVIGAGAILLKPTLVRAVRTE